jgi:RNA polymerase sigma-70 factor (ECF subfamily)
VIELMSQLPPQQQEVMKLRTWGDCSLQEIAEITGMSHDNARTLLSRARRKLKELYNNCRK